MWGLGGHKIFQFLQLAMAIIITYRLCGVVKVNILVGEKWWSCACLMLAPDPLLIEVGVGLHITLVPPLNFSLSLACQCALDCGHALWWSCSIVHNFNSTGNFGHWTELGIVPSNNYLQVMKIGGQRVYFSSLLVFIMPFPIILTIEPRVVNTCEYIVQSHCSMCVLVSFKVDLT